MAAPTESAIVTTRRRQGSAEMTRARAIRLARSGGNGQSSVAAMPISNARSDEVAPSVSAHAAQPLIRRGFASGCSARRSRNASFSRAKFGSSAASNYNSSSIAAAPAANARVAARRRRSNRRARSQTASARPAAARASSVAITHRRRTRGPSKCGFSDFSSTRCITHSNRSIASIGANQRDDVGHEAVVLRARHRQQRRHRHRHQRQPLQVVERAEHALRSAADAAAPAAPAHPASAARAARSSGNSNT